MKKKTDIWFDRWCDLCPLNMHVTPRQMAQEGLSIYSKLIDVHHLGVWNWPVGWCQRFPALSQLPNLNLVPNKDDMVVWRSGDSNNKPFSTSLAWDVVRRRGQSANWSKLVWSSWSIP